MAELILALDQGTTGSTAIVLDALGVVQGKGYEPVHQHYPRPGWVEHDPAELWESALTAAGRALAAGGVSPDELAAIGLANQRETTLLWERRTGRPVSPAVVWQCRRTPAQCAAMRAQGLEARVRDRTGLVLDPYFSGTKLRWLLDADPDVRARAERGDLAFGTVDTWLVWNLTGGRVHVTDASNASRTLMLSLDAGSWDPEMLELLGVPQAVLPSVVASSGVVGETMGTGAIPAGLPIAALVGDQQAALFGQGCHAPGMAKNTYGTGCFVLVQAGQARPRAGAGILETVAWRIGDATHYALEGSVFVAGAAVQWLRDELGMIKTAEESEALARSVPDTNGVTVVPAFVGLGAPHWDPGARGTIVGLTRGASRAHVVRAVLESIAHQTADVLDAMRDTSGIVVRELRVDGGAAANSFLMQFQADLLGVPTVRPAMLESTALGAAYLAGLAVGLWRSPQEAVGTRRPERVFEPRISEAQRQRLREEWARAVACARSWSAGQPEAPGSV